MKKEIVLFSFVLFMLISSNFASASLGIMPARREVNFEPNLNYNVTFSTWSDNPQKIIEIYSENSENYDLAQYVSFDKQVLQGSGQFTATLNLPSSLSIPGRNRVYIVVSEKIPASENFVGVGTAIKLKGSIFVLVPYPGKYIESEFTVPDANIGEKIPAELKVTSRGVDNILVNPTFDFYDSSGKKVETMYFTPVPLKTNEVANFGKYLDSTNLKPDNYLAVATIDYGAGEKKILNKTFRIGNLNVAVINFTQNATAGEISKFTIKIKSNWNGKIDGVFANVNVSNANSSYIFGTSPENLAPWEEKEIFGYLDAKEIKAGDYNVEIRLNYPGGTTYSSGKIQVLKKNISKILLISGGIVAGLILIIIIYFVIKKIRGSNKKKTR